MRTMSNECEMKVMMIQRLDIRMKSAIEERFPVIFMARWEGGGWGKSKFCQLSGWGPGLGIGAMQFNKLWKRNASTE